MDRDLIFDFDGTTEQAKSIDEVQDYIESCIIDADNEWEVGNVADVYEKVGEFQWVPLPIDEEGNEYCELRYFTKLGNIYLINVDCCDTSENGNIRILEKQTLGFSKGYEESRKYLFKRLGKPTGKITDVNGDIVKEWWWEHLTYDGFVDENGNQIKPLLNIYTIVKVGQI